MPLTDQTVAEARDLAARYPQARSALLPMLHLVQSEEGLITSAGIELCADVLDLTTAEVVAVATFYTMYRQRPPVALTTSVCTNTLCGLLGGDAVYEALSRRLGSGTTRPLPTGHSRWNGSNARRPAPMPRSSPSTEFFDQMTIDDAMTVIDQLVAGDEVLPAVARPCAVACCRTHRGRDRRRAGGRRQGR